LYLAKTGDKLTEMTNKLSDYIGVPQIGPFKLDHYRH